VAYAAAAAGQATGATQDEPAGEPDFARGSSLEEIVVTGFKRL
jgi:hypothetical protein